MPSVGYLTAYLFTSNGQIPVDAATVTVTQSQPDGLQELLAIWITDESGKTPTLTLPTPQPAASQVPSPNPSFAVVTLTAEHPLYQRAVVEDVQVFPENLSTQNLQLIPLDQWPEAWDQTETIRIHPQNL